MEKPKSIHAFGFKTKTVYGILSKTYVRVYANGAVLLFRLYLSTDDDNKLFNTQGYTKLRTFKDKTLWLESTGFKYNSLCTIFKETSGALIRNKIDPKDII